MEMLTAPPKVGDKVAVVMHSGQWSAPRMVRKSTVVAVRDHKPIDGTDERNALVDLADGSTEFWWNLAPNVCMSGALEARPLDAPVGRRG